MKIKGLKDEDFVNYRKPSMFIGLATCDWKCCNEQSLDKSICQNSTLAQSKTFDMSEDEIFLRYINNPITSAIVLGGLEPFLQFDEVFKLVSYFRDNGCNDTFVIYTGYYQEEIQDELLKLKEYKNIIIKFGRFIPEQDKHLDDVLGVYLASDNQYAKTIS